MIKLFRVDHRLIHGQVVFSWVKQYSINRIIVADDIVPNNPMAKMALSMAKPTDCELDIVPINQVASVVEANPKDQIMILAKGPVEALAVTEQVPEITEINYGGVAKKDGSKQYGKTIFLNDEELEATRKIIAKNVKIVVQQVPAVSPEKVDFNK
ncbi:PTS sugar transporter subunit IIB [Lactobacillus sp. ESL0679]|uniref:PTS sugar transporter subunit IIB n=1 Tax=Lactobacillus sp. ESL0679 TaxID=2983209 RepID=UPI0023FA0EE3|nr:PTS sugar transporter subunit IIB [Lactobacillus sp. ESL0679]MDF7683588.1 PTS sugar transporter subunit IIB [Lactobacillus sp. ESL0679]